MFLVAFKASATPACINLVTQESYSRWLSDPYLEWFEAALLSMRQQAEDGGINKIAMDRNATGLSGLKWGKFKPIIQGVFGDWPGELIIYETYSQADILHQFVVGPYLTTENLYANILDVRLSAFRDETRWALTMEMLGVTDHDWCDHGGIHNWVSFWGNCGLIEERHNQDLICPTDDGPDGP